MAVCQPSVQGREEQWRLGWPEFGYVEAARLTPVARAQASAVSESPTVNAVIQRGCPRGYVRRLLDRMLEAGSPWTALVVPISADEERADGIAWAGFRSRTISV